MVNPGTKTASPTSEFQNLRGGVFVKKTVAFILCLLLLIPCARAENMAFSMLRALYTSGENTVLSPVSLNTALNMAAEGALGITKEELLAFTDDLASGEIASANVLFVSERIALKPDYEQALLDRCAAEAFAIDENIVENANRWISEKTGGMIENFMQAPPADTGLVLINAVAMDKEWRFPFDPERTSPEKFFTGDQSLTVPMMRQTEDFLYCEKDGTQIVRLPYKDSALEMWIVLPEENGMPALLDALAEAGPEPFIQDAATREVILSLPKIDITDDNDLVGPLKALGVNAAFAPEADFSAMSDTPMRVGSVRQKARITMDEESTKAAAVTQVVMLATALAPDSRPEPIVMTVNRPYLLMIRDGETGALCFNAVVENPSL